MSWRVEKTNAVLCVGEAMAMVTPASRTSLVDSDTFTISPGGAEANVASHLAAMGFDSKWVSRLGDDALGDRIADTLSARGVDIGYVVRDPNAPTGVYFKDPVPGARKSIYYYRARSAASMMSLADIHTWPLASASWVHTSGITAALSESCASMVKSLIDQSTRFGYRVSFDVNYRAGLWTSLQSAAERCIELGRGSQVLFVGLDEAHELWGVSTAEQVADLFPTVPSVVVKDGGNEAVEILQTSDGNREVIRMPALRADVVEAIGAGDAFASAFLAGYLRADHPERRLAAGHELAAWTLGSLDDHRAAIWSEND